MEWKLHLQKRAYWVNYLSTTHDNEIHDNEKGIFSIAIGSSIYLNTIYNNEKAGITDAGKDNDNFNNDAYNNGMGILTVGYDNKVFNNNASGNILQNNIMHGIGVLWSNGTEIFNNIVNNNQQSGIGLAESTDVKVYDNTANYNKNGISVSGLLTQGTTFIINITNNTANYNSRAGIILSSSMLGNWIETIMTKSSSQGHNIINSYVADNNLYNIGDAYDFGSADGTGSHVYNNTIIQNNFNGKGVYDNYAGNNDYCAGVGNNYGVNATIAPGDCPGNTAPVAAILAPANNSVFVNGTEINFIGEGIDAEDGNLTESSLEWNSDIDPGFVYGENLNLTFPSPGFRVITLTAIDSFGVEDNYSININITPAVINNPPTAIITAPINNSVFTSGTLIDFTGLAYDLDQANNTLSVLWWSSIDGILDTTPPDASGNVDFSTNLLSINEHIIMLNVTDFGGLTGSDSVFVNVTA